MKIKRNNKENKMEEKNEVIEEVKLTLEQKYNKFLAENNCQPAVVVLAPKGGYVAVQNYTPEGWEVQVVMVEKNK